MTIAVVTTGSTYTGSATGGVPNSSNRWAHLGFVASGAQTFMSPMMNNPNGFFVSDIYGGSAIIWLRASAS